MRQIAMTKEAFKTRWDSNERGGGITYNDIANCAEAWGLVSCARVCDISNIKIAVLKAANVRQIPCPF